MNIPILYIDNIIIDSIKETTKVRIDLSNNKVELENNNKDWYGIKK